MAGRIRINREQVQNIAGAAAYTKGSALYRSRKITDFQVDELYDNDYIKAEVAGSYDNAYDVFITYDREQNMLQDAYCDCPAFDSHSGICKHCVATLFRYEDYINKNRQGEQPGHQISLAELAPLRGNYQIKKRKTTDALKQLLATEAATAPLMLVEDQNYGKVRLEPHFTYMFYEISISFKIGIGRMYVLKDMIEFTKWLEEQQIHTYGKELSFRHTPEMFDEASKPLVEFLLNWVRNNKDAQKYMAYFSGDYGYAYRPIRKISPTPGDVEEFFAALGREKFQADIEGEPSQKWQIVDAPYREQLIFRREEDGIILHLHSLMQMETNNYIFYFAAGRIYRVALETLVPVQKFRELFYDLEEDVVYIQQEDVPAFIRNLLPKLEAAYDCEFGDFDPAAYGVVPARFEIYLDLPQPNFLTMKGLAVYEEEKYNIYDKETNAALRDLVSEAQVARILSHYGNAFDEPNQMMALADDEERLYEVLSEGIERMQKIADVYVSDALKRISGAYTPKVTLGLSLAGEKLEIALTAEEMSTDELAEILSKYDRKKKYFRLKSGQFVNMEDDNVQALLDLKEGLGLSPAQIKSGAVQLPKYRALYLDGELKEKKAFTVVKDKSFKSLIRNMKTVEDNDFEIPPTLDPILREYQKQGFLWLKTLKNNGFGGILADDMGLGKTIQVIALLVSEAEAGGPGRTLIVCPASLVYNWQHELEKYAPQLPATMVVGTKRERKSRLQDAGPAEILITSYDLLKRDLELYQELSFAVQVIDEAQFIKNHNTQVAKAVKQIAAGFRLALTGTPVENSLSELWSIFDYLMPGFFYAYGKFREELELPIVAERDERAKQRLQKMLRPFVLRRLKKDVLTDLPDKLEENYFARATGEQRKLYDAHVQRMKLLLDKTSDAEFKTAKIQILAELTKLRQLCCDPALLYQDYHAESTKLELCLDLVKKAVGGGHKILLFSQFTSMLEILTARLAAAGISFLTLTGATGKEKRARLVDEFNAGQADVFCISLKAGGTGLNLTAADIVIHYDPWWNQAVQNQATDRAHRIGQKHVVNVFKLIVKDTIEENILRIQEQKSQLADEILAGEGISAASFSKEELLELL